MREAVEALRSTGLRTGWPYYLALVVGACGALGHLDEALRLQAEAIEVGCETGEHCWDAELWRLRGELLGQYGTTREPEAGACFRRAIEVARAQGARSWELRAATSLARLLRVRGEPRQGCELLTDCYSAFTEGFDTPDLQDARTLLTSLG
jgi:predicted ATPase